MGSNFSSFQDTELKLHMWVNDSMGHTVFV